MCRMKDHTDLLNQAGYGIEGDDMNEQQTPTPIDPADIRPGDTFRLVHEATCTRIDEAGLIEVTDGTVFSRVTLDGMSWHLVHRPDPDAEAVEALARNVLEIDNPDAYDLKNVALALHDLREQGWDVVRRQNGQEHV